MGMEVKNKKRLIWWKKRISKGKGRREYTEHLSNNNTKGHTCIDNNNNNNNANIVMPFFFFQELKILY